MIELEPGRVSSRIVEQLATVTADEGVVVRTDAEKATVGRVLTSAARAVGTTPTARLVGTLAEDKRTLGTVHFAIGDDESLGGTAQRDTHLDGVVLAPTVRLDDDIVRQRARDVGLTRRNRGDVVSAARERARER